MLSTMRRWMRAFSSCRPAVEPVAGGGACVAVALPPLPSCEAVFGVASDVLCLLLNRLRSDMGRPLDSGSSVGEVEHAGML